MRRRIKHKKPKCTGKRFVIKSISDFCSIPDDRIDECVRQFAAGLHAMHAFNELFDDCKATFDEFIWTDDGKSDITTELLNAEISRIKGTRKPKP